MTTKKTSSFDWKYFLFISIFILICLEIFGRVYLTYVLKKSAHPKFQFNSYRIYEHIPNFHEGDGKKDWLAINGQGFRRSTEVIKEKPANTYRVFLLGGSAAHGISSAPPYPVVHIYMNQTVDYYIEKMLEKKHPGKHFEVINAAVTGYQVFQHTFYIITELLDYNPDLVIFLDGANDHYLSNPDYDYIGNHTYQFWKPRLQHASIKGWFQYGLLWMTKYSGFARGLFAWTLKSDAAALNEKNLELAYKKYANDEEYIKMHKKSAKKNFLRSIETNISILNNSNIKSLVCLQPMLVLRDTTLMSLNEKNFNVVNRDINLLYPTVSDELKELTTKYSVPYVDLNVEFNKEQFWQKQLFIDYCHLSPLGGNVIATRLFPVVDSIFVSSNK